MKLQRLPASEFRFEDWYGACYWSDAEKHGGLVNFIKTCGKFWCYGSELETRPRLTTIAVFFELGDMTAWAHVSPTYFFRPSEIQAIFSSEFLEGYDPPEELRIAINKSLALAREY